MPNFINVIIILLFVVGPIINKIYQSMAEKQAMEQERQRRLRESVRTQRARGENPEIAPETRIEMERTPASTRQADLAARRKAEIEAWRSRQAAARQQQAQRAGSPGASPSQSGWNPVQASAGGATPSQPQSVDSEITRRRRAAIEEMRRRRAGANRQSTPDASPSPAQKPRRTPKAPPSPQRPASIPAVAGADETSLIPQRRRRKSIRSAPVTAFAGLGTGRRLAGLTASQLREAIILKELLDTPPGLRELNQYLKA